jgi:uncharacterized protein
MIPLVEQRIGALTELCRRFGVRRLDLFGSAATGGCRDAASDLDFVVAFADTRSAGYADRYLLFAEALEALFGREVDLLTERAIRNPYLRREVEATRQNVYAERDPEAAA